MPASRSLRSFSAALLIAPLSGCVTSEAHEAGRSGAAAETTMTVLELPAREYATVFATAIEVAIDEGLPIELRDRDGGIIETRTRVSGSLIEPWNWVNGDIAEATAASVAFQRRKARFEFVPAGFRPQSLSDDEALGLPGRRVPGTVPPDEGGAVDLTQYDGPIELRIWVFIERAFTPGLQRSSWTFTQTSFYTDPLAHRPVGDGSTRDRSVWTPIDRDEDMERRLLADLRGRLESASASAPEGR